MGTKEALYAYSAAQGEAVDRSTSVRETFQVRNLFTAGPFSRAPAVVYRCRTCTYGIKPYDCILDSPRVRVVVACIPKSVRVSVSFRYLHKSVDTYLSNGTMRQVLQTSNDDAAAFRLVESVLVTIVTEAEYLHSNSCPVLHGLTHARSMYLHGRSCIGVGASQFLSHG